MALDAWTALKALLPPPERRGVMLIDPAFEQTGELDRLVDGLKEAARRFADGHVPALVSDQGGASPSPPSVAKSPALGLPKATAIELMIRGSEDETRLNGAGLIAVNAPFTLAAKLDALLPELARVLAQGEGAGFKLRGARHGSAKGDESCVEPLASMIFFSDTFVARAHDRPGGDI